MKGLFRRQRPVPGWFPWLDQHDLGSKPPYDLDFGVGSIGVMPFKGNRSLYTGDDAVWWIYPLLVQRICQADGRSQHFVGRCSRSLAVPVVAEMLELNHFRNGWLPRSSIWDRLLFPIDSMQPLRS